MGSSRTLGPAGSIHSSILRVTGAGKNISGRWQNIPSISTFSRLRGMEKDDGQRFIKPLKAPTWKLSNTSLRSRGM